MVITSETSLSNFQFWSGAVENANSLTCEELDDLEKIFEDLYPDGMSDTQINDIMWFDFEWVCEALGLEYDTESGEIVRE